MDSSVTESRLHGKDVGRIMEAGRSSSLGDAWEENACINISEGNCAERIIALARTTRAICKVFAVLTENLKEDICGVIDP